MFRAKTTRYICISRAYDPLTEVSWILCLRHSRSVWQSKYVYEQKRKIKLLCLEMKWLIFVCRIYLLKHTELRILLIRSLKLLDILHFIFAKIWFNLEVKKNPQVELCFSVHFIIAFNSKSACSDSLYIHVCNCFSLGNSILMTFIIIVTFHHMWV